MVSGITKHYIRITPVDINDNEPEANPNQAIIALPNHAPGVWNVHPAKEIVDAGFLELVRYGIRLPHDPVIVDSLKVVDAVLRVDTPFGPCWRRYNHDRYGQRPDGGPYLGWEKVVHGHCSQAREDITSLSQVTMRGCTYGRWRVSPKT